MGSMPDRLLAMQTGNIAAGILSPPYTFGADEAGLVNLGATAKYTPNFVQTVFNVRADFAQDKKPLLIRFLRAILRADHWIHNQKEDTVRIIVKRLSSARNIPKRVGATTSTSTRSPKTARSIPRAWTRSCSCWSKTAPCSTAAQDRQICRHELSRRSAPDVTIKFLRDPAFGDRRYRSPDSQIR